MHQHMLLEFFTIMFSRVYTVHGTCNSPGECNCITGYGGTNCDQDLDVCGHQEPCLHGATCSNEGPDQYSCSCVAGYTGNNCQTDINECGPLPCQNGATCNVCIIIDIHKQS